MDALARKLLSFARIAYLQRDDLLPYLADMGCTLLLSINDLETDTQGYVCRTSAGELIVAFRGTEALNLRDWSTDMDCSLVEDPLCGGRVHRGFLRSAWDCVPMILRALTIEPESPVQIAGHSLGGALATLLALRIQQAGRRITAVHTFGSPRVGDARFAETYDAALQDVTVRHQNCCDVVTRLPSVLQGYRHVGQLRYYDVYGMPLGAATWPYRLWDQISARAMNWGRVPTCGIKHHLLSSYEALNLN